MNRKYVYTIFVLTLLSFFLILFSYVGNKSELLAQEDISLEHPPFTPYISGSGIVEPASGNIILSSPFYRNVEKINVKVNDVVKKGDILFQLYNEDLIANLNIKKQIYEARLSTLNKLKAFPSEQDRIIAQENLNKAQAQFNIAVTEYCMTKRCLSNKCEKCLQQYKYRQAEAEFLAAVAHYNKVIAGTWQPELQIAQDEVAQAKAEIEAMEVEIERTYIKSPLEGTVLQIKIHEGEISNQGNIAMILGNICELNVRVSLDQFNAQRFNPTAPAVAFKQDDSSKEFPLQFINIEPFMIPKKYLTNELQEKVDSQVFEILYRINNKNASLFIGEQMDIYIAG